MVRLCLALTIGLLLSGQADAGLFGRRCRPCQPRVIYPPSTAQPAAQAAANRVQACPDVRQGARCPNGRCFPRKPEPAPPTNPPPFDFPEDDEGDTLPVPVPPPIPSTPPETFLDKINVILAIAATIMGLLAGFGVVKADDDPNDDPENEGIIKAAVSKVKEAI